MDPPLEKRAEPIAGTGKQEKDLSKDSEDDDNNNKSKSANRNTNAKVKKKKSNSRSLTAQRGSHVNKHASIRTTQEKTANAAANSDDNIVADMEIDSETAPDVSGAALPNNSVQSLNSHGVAKDDAELPPAQEPSATNEKDLHRLIRAIGMERSYQFRARKSQKEKEEEEKKAKEERENASKGRAETQERVEDTSASSNGEYYLYERKTISQRASDRTRVKYDRNGNVLEKIRPDGTIVIEALDEEDYESGTSDDDDANENEDSTMRQMLVDAAALKAQRKLYRMQRRLLQQADCRHLFTLNHGLTSCASSVPPTILPPAFSSGSSNNPCNLSSSTPFSSATSQPRTAYKECVRCGAFVFFANANKDGFITCDFCNCEQHITQTWYGVLYEQVRRRKSDSENAQAQIGSAGIAGASVAHLAKDRPGHNPLLNLDNAAPDTSLSPNKRSRTGCSSPEKSVKRVRFSEFSGESAEKLRSPQRSPDITGDIAKEKLKHEDRDDDQTIVQTPNRTDVNKASSTGQHTAGIASVSSAQDAVGEDWKNMEQSQSAQHDSGGPHRMDV